LGEVWGGKKGEGIRRRGEGGVKKGELGNNKDNGKKKGLDRKI